MKKVLAMILALALSVTLLAGCGAGATSGAAKPADEAVTITVWGEQEQEALYAKAMEEINAAFEKENPNIKVNFQWSGSFDALTVAMQSDSLPDVFYSQGNKLTMMSEMAKNGYLLPLKSYLTDTSRFPQDSVDYATVDDELYCSLPAFFAYATVYYNKDIFEKYDLKAPGNWDELVAVCETLKSKDELPMAYGGNGWLDPYWMIGAMAPAYFEQDMDTLSSGEKLTDFSRIEACFTAYTDLLQKGYMGKDYVASDMASAQMQFTNGQAAMIVDGTWNKGLYDGMNIGCFAMPGPDGKKYAQTGLDQSLTYSGSAKTKYPDAVGAYLAYLSGLEAEQTMYNYVSSIPVVKDLDITDEVVLQMADFDVIGSNFYGVLTFAGNDNSAPGDLLTNDIIPKLMAGTYTPAQATQALKDELDK